MTKGADGTTRVINQTVTNNNKSILSSEVNKTPQKEGPQKVQIIRAPDGKLTVRGLLAGQQLIQMPDGKLHVVMPGQQGITGQLVAASPARKTDSDSLSSDTNDKISAQNKMNTESGGSIQSPRISSQSVTPAPALVPSGRHIVVQPAQQMVVASPQVVVQAGARPLQTVLVQGQLLRAPAPPPRPTAPRVAPATPAAAPRPRPAATQQIVVNNPALVQQIAAGKIQLATVNGQQVLIRPTGNNQAQIVAHIGQSPAPAPPAPAPTPPTVPAPATLVRPAAPSLAPAVAPQPLTEDQIMEKRLLAGQPPGTVIKTVTAQVQLSWNFNIYSYINI